VHVRFRSLVTSFHVFLIFIVYCSCLGDCCKGIDKFFVGWGNLANSLSRVLAVVDLRCFLCKATTIFRPENTCSISEYCGCQPELCFPIYSLQTCLNSDICERVIFKCPHIIYHLHFFLWCYGPNRAQAASIEVSRSHTIRHTRIL